MRLRAREMQARIKEKQEVAKGTLLVTFDLLGEEVDFEPGQYFFVTLPDIGHQDDKGLRRHISVVTSPNDRGVLGLATRLRDSAFKRTLRELPVGTEVEVEPPKGDFGLPEPSTRPLVFVAGGIGITVFRSMLLYIREEGLPHRVTLVYSNRDRESTAFLDELRELEQQIPDLRLILTMTEDPGWEGETRMVDAQFFKDHLSGSLDQYTFLVAGPPAMTEGVQKALDEAGVQEENVIAESYSGY
jgi:ferredoxin-NADP reductase